ncbi:Cd(II)/Pb(II)-responsive transcriptional regulator [Variovorax sp. J22R133]|uniref:Cd(II)/Pb(II)-responsive transcriptional regulator n=1 Tax=Variovorax brevis TaxID=3053503 RepID=UPI002575159C|nr:Cd(II)/Pb(II)-responsive transcriptional regulator [Variovorax sp. J22R133]MDM0113909.1 Cd(II)/Pb(II)-responsive transcriptional regulator [Variovorax sp. J22R133]
MKIGELAQATATPVETIRFYEREALLPTPGRTDGNYRVYGQEHVERLTFIRHCRSLDMALEEIRSLLRFKELPQENCAGVNDLLDEHIGHVAQRIRELRVLEKQLKVLRQQCGEVDAAARCGILKELSSDTPALALKSGARRHIHSTH